MIVPQEHLLICSLRQIREVSVPYPVLESCFLKTRELPLRLIFFT